jgi:hypothetical protein
MATSDSDRGPQIFVVNAFFSAAAVVIVLLRVYTRAMIVKAFGLDDWLIILATVRACRSRAPCPDAPAYGYFWLILFMHRFSSSCLLSYQMWV